MVPDVVASHKAEIQLESLDAEAVLEKSALELGESAVAEDDVLVPCNVEPIPSLHLGDSLLPFQQIP